MSEDSGFLSRWSRRKADVKAGREAPVAPPVVERVVPQEPVRPEPVEGPSAEALRPAQPERLEPPAPTLDDVQALAPGDEVSRFVARGVDESVKRAAVKKLFADPHFNIIDGLDIYIDDYSQPDPIPMAMLRQLNQAKFMNLFAAEEAAEAAQAATAAEAAKPSPPLAQDAGAAATEAAAVPHAPDEDADLQLQPDDPARREST